MIKITIHDIKQALLDERFRNTLPDDLKEDVDKFLSNPGCACNHPIYIRVMKKARKQVSEYFPTKDEVNPEEMEKEINKMAANQWQVINCHMNDLAEELRKLGAGRKQIDVARWQDQVTVVVNHIDMF